jgi:hypothetical protein
LRTNGTVEFDNVTVSSSPTTGAVILKGGLGVGGKVCIGDGTDSSTKDTGCLIVEGGVGVEKTLTTGGKVLVKDTTDSTTKDTGCAIIEGGLGIEKRLSVGNAVLFPIWKTSIAYVVGDVVKHATLSDFYTCIVAHTSGTFATDVASGDWSKMTKNPFSSTTVTATYTILDYDNYDTIFANPSALAFSVNLPTLADNIGRIIQVKVIAAGGAVSLTPEGAETIDNVNAAFVIQSSGDHCTVVGETSGWRILSGKQTLETGNINRSDNTNVHVGSSQLTYDTLTGTFTVGEVITEYTDAGRTTPSGVSGIMMSDTGSVCVMKNMAGTGVWTNNYYLKGRTSNAVALVNVNTINVDTNLTHNFGVSVIKLTVSIFVSSDGAEANFFSVPLCVDTNNYIYGAGIIGVNTNSFTIQFGGNGSLYLTQAASGDHATGYINIRVTRVI